VAVAVKPGLTGFGAFTVKYDGKTDEPKNAGTYAVTVDIAEGENNIAAAGISLGNYTINKSILTVVGADVTPKTYDGTTDANITDVSFVKAWLMAKPWISALIMQFPMQGSTVRMLVMIKPSQERWSFSTLRRRATTALLMAA
jgi:hypothetical protein